LGKLRYHPPYFSAPSLTGLVHSRLECAGECAMPSKPPSISPLFKAENATLSFYASKS
jgi:hypothetical protein